MIRSWYRRELIICSDYYGMKNGFYEVLMFNHEIFEVKVHAE